MAGNFQKSNKFLIKRGNYYKSFCMINLKSIRTIKPTRIKKIPKYEFKERSKLIIFD